MSRAAAIALWLAGSGASGGDVARPQPQAGCGPLAAWQAQQSVPVSDFLETMGVNLHVAQGYPAASYREPLRYLGLSQIREGYQHIGDTIALAKVTGMRIAVLAHGDMDDALEAARQAKRAGVLTAIEGPNEPNNFPISYEGNWGGRRFGWLAVARFQRDLYARVKADPVLHDVPVFSVSETGAETEDVGLQFLTIPTGAKTAMPAGTRYADYASVHNYLSPPSGYFGPNQTWQAADPVLQGRWDGLAGNFGRTWHKGFAGYADADLQRLPRVTTETGMVTTDDASSQRLQAVSLVNAYLAQFARGWRYTYVYQLRDDEGGKGKHGLYAGNKPKLAAHYIHALTGILRGGDASTGQKQAGFSVRIAADVDTVHALAFTRGDGARLLVVWNETTTVPAPVRVDLGRADGVTVYDVAHGTSPVAQLEAKASHCLSVGVDAMILKW